MNKRQLPKLIALADGILGRASENSEYFLEILIEYHSGLKSQTARIIRQENGFTLVRKGESRPLLPRELSSILEREAPLYDRVTLTYRERGQTFVLTADDKAVKSSRLEERNESPAPHNPLLKEKKYLLTPSSAAPLLQVLDIMTKDGKIKNDRIRKYNQIDRFLSLVAPLFSGEEEIYLLDCGCGKSYLSFALNFLFREILKKKCFIWGVDRNEEVISASRDMASRLSYHNMEFIRTDLADFAPDPRTNAVVSLHACDTATDMALGIAVNCGAKNILCVPCCHKELKDDLAIPSLGGILRHGILRARLNDAVTDGLRALQLEALGYEVSMVEYVSPVDTPKNLLMQAKKTAPKSREKQKELEELCRTLQVRPSFTYRYLDPGIFEG